MEVEIRLAKAFDLDAILSIDQHISRETCLKSILEQRILIVQTSSQMIGVLRFGYFWDMIPAIHLIFILESFRGKGVGQKLHDAFEQTMKKMGYHKLMTTTQSDETGQAFFKKMGYELAGSFKYPNQADELIMFKDLI